MGEQPLHTCRAQVFSIDPKTMKTWCPLSPHPIDVSFFYDPNKKCYRIVGIEENPFGKKVVIHSSLTEKMSFKKTSQKFGQWADSKAGTVFGLGFTSEVDLDKFCEHFTHSVEATKANRRDSDSTTKTNYSHSANDSIVSIDVKPSTNGVKAHQQSTNDMDPDQLRQALTLAQCTARRLEGELVANQRQADQRIAAFELECKRLTAQLEDQVTNGMSQVSISMKERLETENKQLKERVANMETQLSTVTTEQASLAALHNQMSVHVKSLVEMHDQLGRTVKPTS